MKILQNQNLVKMDKYVLLFFMCISLGFISNPIEAQVSGLSYTLSPYAEQNWTNERSGLKNGIMGGAMLGMGFGEFVELRANYAKGFGFETDLSKFGFETTEDQILAYMPREIDISRYGGELTLNLSKGAFLPYLSLGTGIQSIGYDSLSTSKQIFLNAGLGIKFSAGDRYTIGVQAINTRYNYSAVNFLMDDIERESYGLIKEDFLSEPISNWAVRASLVLYLGGRKPGQMSDIDKAYRDNFAGGFSGLNVPVEFQVSRMNFNEELPFRDTWMAGGSAGLNFGPLVGIRGFYWRALEEGERTEFDQLSMYGLEGRFKLNEGKGFTPWITLGAGNINVGEDYVGNLTVDSVGITGIDNKGFAMGGLGMDLPFSKYVKATGFVRSMLTTSQNFEDLTEPEEIKSSWNYGVSLNFVLGKNKKQIDVVKQSAFDEYMLTNNAENSAATEALKSQYEDQIEVLESQLNEAILNQDVQAVEEINDKKNKAEQIVDELNQKKYNQANNSVNPDGGMRIAPGNGGSEIRMSPAEFNLLIRDILDGTNRGNNGNGQSYNNMSGGNNENGQSIESAISDYKKDQQIELLTESLAEIKTSLGSITTAQEGMTKDNEILANTLSELVKTMNTQVTALENKLAKNSSDLEAMTTRQVELDKRFSSKTDEQIKMQSFESEQLQRDIDFTNEKIDDLRALMLNTLSGVTANNNNSSNTNAQVAQPNMPQPEVISNSEKVQTAESYDNSKGFFSKLKYNGMSGFTGFNIGGNTTFNLGYRLHYKVGNSNLEFVPETFFGFGSPSAFGISMNGLYGLDFLTKSNTIKPYAGLGLGFMKVGDDVNVDKLTGAWNFIIGTSLNVLSGDLYVDLTARNAFKYNQLIVGYRFPF